MAKKLTRKEKERAINAAGYFSKNQIEKLKVIQSTILKPDLLDQSADDFGLTYEQFEAKYLGCFIPSDRYQGRTVKEILEKVSLTTMKFDLKYAKRECKETYMSVLSSALRSRKPGVNKTTLKLIEFVPLYHRLVRSYCKSFLIDFL